MEQEKNKVPSQDNENPGSEKFQRAQELYERYFISNAEADFEEMITVLDSIYKNKVRTELWKKGCHDEENYQDAMQEARQGIWTQIKKQRKTGEVRKDFSQYCGGIYTHKAVDIAKKKNSYEQKLREVKRKGKKGKEDQKSYMEVVYLDANLPDSDGTYGELAADPNKKNRAESEVFAEESRNIFGIYLQKYCQAMTNAKAEPPRALALYYARILPHVLYIMYGIETIPDSKGGNYHFIQCFGILFQGDVQRTSSRFYFFGFITHVADNERSSRFYIQTEISIQIGNRSVGSSFLHYGSPNDGTCGIAHFSGYLVALLLNSLGTWFRCCIHLLETSRHPKGECSAK